MYESKWLKGAGRSLGAAVFGLVTASCGPDLGECTNPALMQLPTAVTRGQELVNSRCANGVCHSVDARGSQRHGAPGELNFDLLVFSEADRSKAREGLEQVNDRREDIWGEVEEGSMPPGPPAGMGELSDADKETIREWLACGAPTFGGVVDVTPGGDDWTSIYASLTSDTLGCATCHGEALAATSGNGFKLGDPGDACAAYLRVFNAPAVTTQGMPVACASSGGRLVVPNQPAMSLLLDKINGGGAPACGGEMPLGRTGGLGPTNEVVLSLERWIMAGAPKPANCP